VCLRRRNERRPRVRRARAARGGSPPHRARGVEHAFLSTNPEAFCRIPSFAAWRESQDLQPGYDLLARMLRSLSWQKRRRGETGERWILKTPFHLGHMDVLLRSFPDARIVWTHRDPLQSLPSFASLIHSLRVLGSDSVDPIDVGREWSGKMARAIGRCMDVRARHEERFLDLDYRDLVADPLACALRVYRFAGLPLSDAVRAGMRRWAVENARDKRPEHRYTLERFGFDADALAVQFARYRERFVTG
jgi:hypothetical protein